MGSAASAVSLVYGTYKEQTIIDDISGVPNMDVETQMMLILIRWLRISNIQTLYIFPIDLIWLIIDKFTYQIIFNKVHSDKLTYPHKYTPIYDHTKYRQNNNSSSNCSFKILLMGDKNVGKFSFIHKFTNNKFPSESLQNNRETLEPGFTTVQLCNIDDMSLDLYFWYGNTLYWTGYHQFNPYGGADAIIIMYDITDRKSFENLRLLHQHIDKYAAYMNPLKVVIGNKLDLSVDDESCITYNEGYKYCENNNIDIFMEISSKTGYHIRECMEMITMELIKPYKRKTIPFYG